MQNMILPELRSLDGNVADLTTQVNLGEEVVSCVRQWVLFDLYS